MKAGPIMTRYKGYRFRSRTEARWAVYLDKAQIIWEYEPQGYCLENGELYLPDFWLPRDGAFLEVKPGDDDPRVAKFTVGEKRKALELCELTKSIVAMVDGVPRQTNYWAYYWDAYAKEVRLRAFYFNCFDNKMWWDRKGFFDDWEHRDGVNITDFECVVAARSARFEHGEEGPG